MDIKRHRGQKNDPRPSVSISLKDGRTLRIVGYDELPHLVFSDGAYNRTTWEMFRQYILANSSKAHGTEIDSI